MKAYLANGLFSRSDFLYNYYLFTKIDSNFPELDIYLPQNNEAINDKTQYANSVQISRGDDKELLEADFLIAIIDGVEIDSGVSCEIGKFAGFDIAVEMIHKLPRRPIFALYTDVRQQGRDNQNKINALVEDGSENQFPYRNLYVVGTIKDSGGKIVDNEEDLILTIKEFIESER